MKIQQFQGGLATRLRPQFLQQNQGVVYDNIDNSVGTLAPVKKPLATGILLDKFHTYYDAQQMWVSSTTRRDYVEYSGDLYWADRVGRPQKFDGTTQTNLGIIAPPQLTGFTNTTIPKVQEVTIEPVTGAGLPKEDTTYLLVNSDGVNISNPTMFEVSAVDGLTNIEVTSRGYMLPHSRQGSTAPLVRKVAATTRHLEIKEPLGFTIGAGGVEVYRLFRGTFYLVGTLANSASTITDSTYDISGNAVLDEDKYYNLQGTYQYLLTYYNSTNGIESGPSPVSAEQDFTNGGTATLTSLPVSTDAQVDKKRLYRIGGNLSAFTLVTELANATTSYSDTLIDSELDGTLLETADASPAPAGLAYLAEAYAMLFGALGSKVRFTPIGKPSEWPELYFLQFDATITGIVAVTHGILVFTKFKTYIISGTGPTSLSQQTLSNDQGCLAFESAQSISGSALWVSTDGICTSDGNTVTVISKDMLGKRLFNVIDSVVHDEAYYALLSDYAMICFDFAYGKIFKTFSLANQSIVVGNDTLYGWYDGELYEMFAHADSASFSYTSPRFIEGSAVEMKTYKNVRVYHKGDVLVKLLINDVLVATQQMQGEDSSTVKMPQTEQRGTFIQFQLSGTGEVYEIEYITGGRHNA
jgi:hypothetical protein